MNLSRPADDILRGGTVRPALVVSVGRNSAWTVFEDEDVPRLASIRRTSRKPGKSDGGARSMLVPGDVVDARPLEDETVVVERIHERKFALERRTVTGRTKIMVANVDTIAIVAALSDPPVRLSMIDQLVAFAELQGLRALLFLTKSDLVAPGVGEKLAALYQGLGYGVLLVQPKDGQGIPELRAELGRTHALLVGQSGVGKSSIFAALGGTSRVGDVSRHGRGKQTTTTARLFRLEDGFLIDSPGVGAFELGEIDSRELTEAFRDFRDLAAGCRFRDCAHLAEPGCSIRGALEAGTILPSRYESYRLILARGDPLSAYDRQDG